MGCGSSSTTSTVHPSTSRKAVKSNAGLGYGWNPPVQVALQPFAPQGAPAIYHGTIRSSPYFDSMAAAQKLRNAMKGTGTKESAIIEVLASCDSDQRLEMLEVYSAQQGKDLKQDIKSELSGDFEETVRHLLESPAEYDAWLLREAIAGPGTADDNLMEILSFRSRKHLENVQVVYKSKYGKDLVKDIQGDTSGNYETLLLRLLKGERDAPHIVIKSIALTDAKLMHKEGANRLGTDDDFFIDLFVSRSWEQLGAACKAYEELYTTPIEKMIDSEFSGDINYGLKKLVVFAKDRALYFAERIYEAMKGLGTEDQELQRLIIRHCEVDLMEIKEAFRLKYGIPMTKMIREDTSGDYQELLLALVN